MKNSLINSFKNKIKLNVKGKNIERFIRRLIKNEIDIISLERIKYDEIDIIVHKKDYELIDSIKTIYIINIKRYYGLDNIKKKLIRYKYLLSFLIIGLIIIYVLSNMIFNIKVIYSDASVRKMIIKELKNNGISKYKFKKSYKEKEKIKERILNKYNKELEWIEIEEKGTTYQIRLEERKITKEKKKDINRDIIASKNGIILSVEAKRGDIIKYKNDYVKKGDTIISGIIYLNDEAKNITSATGSVIAETWYTVTLDVPYIYNRKIKTGKNKKVLTIKFLDNYYDIFNFKKYKNKDIKDKIIFKNSFIPMQFSLQKQYETIVIKKVYSKKNIDSFAFKEAKKRLMKKKKNIEIINYKIIYKEDYKKYVKYKIFFSVKEDITDYKEIKELPIKEEE